MTTQAEQIKINKTHEWYDGLTPKQIVFMLDLRKNTVLSYARQGDLEKAEEFFDSFLVMYEQAKSVASDMATEFYMYRKHNDIYNTWRQCMEDIDTVRNDIDLGLMEIIKEN